MAASSVGETSILSALNWLPCTFCVKHFTGQEPYYFLACKKVACHSCATKIVAQTNRKKIDCPKCKKTVSVLAINDDMPAHIRKMFSDTEKMLNEAMRIDEFQQGLCSLAIQFQMDQANRLQEEEVNIRAETERSHQMLERIEGTMKQYEQEILKVMDRNMMEDLLALDETQLNQLDPEQIIGPLMRSRSSSSSMRPPNQPIHVDQGTLPDGRPIVQNPHGSNSPGDSYIPGRIASRKRSVGSGDSRHRRSSEFHRRSNGTRRRSNESRQSHDRRRRSHEFRDESNV